MNRSDSDDFTLITNQTTGDELLNVNGLNFDHRATPRVFLTRETSDCWGIDIGFMGIDSWFTSESRGTPTVSPTAFGPNGDSFPSAAPGTVYQANYGTNLYSGEVNLRRRCNECVTWLAGFRWMELDDLLFVRQSAATPQALYQVDTNNHMYGFQIGGEAELINCQQRFHVDSLFRAGILFNNADQATYAPIYNGAAPAILNSITADDDHTAFIGELGLRAVYELNRCVSITGGYHIMLLDGVALAPDQLPVTNLSAPGSAVLDTNGTLFFHGASVGVRVNY